MLQGKIKWYNTEKGFGFIINEEGKDIFFHRSGIDPETKNKIADGVAVSYEMTQGLKGPQATRVKVV
ncbi:MAG: cold shock domain-containing protein [Bacteroidales bacterium]|nr:cold shock domain-containing protein [Bacteroidales bacterium]MCF8388766.1 cold shock domain-containing protein [Bacteroidales bacterium]MCF8399159.1 cold shock domain-containing protein [Bacteroidales bacterium]